MSQNIIYCFSGTGNCLDIAKNIAKALGGGGHLVAAGCTLKLPANQALAMMLAEMEKEIRAHSAKAE